MKHKPSFGCMLFARSNPLKPYLHPRRTQSEAGVLDLERLVDAQEAIIAHHCSQDDLDLKHGEQPPYTDPRTV